MVFPIDMKYSRLDLNIADVCGRAIVLSGSARSGTTITGKILHSFTSVEYCFEPSTLFSVFALMEKIEEPAWRLLYETYLYEEFLMNALAGRNLNCNRADDSSIYRVKSAAEVEARQARSLGKSEAEVLTADRTLAFKMPDIVPFLGRLKEFYPQTRLVMMRRNAVDTFVSLRRKGWFTDETLRTRNLNWPNTFIDGLRVPFWVRPDDHEKWAAMDELHRIAYYYLLTNGGIAALDATAVVDYEALVERPREVARELADTLGLSFGPKTEEILATVAPCGGERDAAILDGLDPDVRMQVEACSSHGAER